MSRGPGVRQRWILDAIADGEWHPLVGLLPPGVVSGDTAYRALHRAAHVLDGEGRIRLRVKSGRLEVGPIGPVNANGREDEAESPKAPKAKRPPPSASSAHATERQRTHRLRDRLRPQAPVSADADPWEIANDILIGLGKIRAGIYSTDLGVELEICEESVKMLAWGPESS